MSSKTPILEIKKITDPVVFSTDEELNEFAIRLVNAGYTVISPSEPSTYFTYHVKGGKAYGYVEVPRYKSLGMKYDFSRSYVPSPKNGSGTGMLSDAELTVENACLTLVLPLPDGVVQYATFDAFMKEHTWQGLNVVDREEKLNYPKNSYGTIS